MDTSVPTFLLREPVFDLTKPETLDEEYGRLLARLTGQEKKGPPVAPSVHRVDHEAVASRLRW